MQGSGNKTLFHHIARKVLRSKRVKAKATRYAANRQLRRLVRNFAFVPIAEITEECWTDYVARENLKAPRTFYDDRKYMRQVLFLALRKRIIAEVVRLPIPDLPWDAGREITPGELERLEKAAGLLLRFQIRIAWKMGLRLREMLRLRWEQVDLETGVVTLEKTDTKTRRGRRVPIPSDLLPEFRAWRVLVASKYVFPSPDVDGPSQHNQTAWNRCRRRANVEARWHDLRHTCATLLLRRGVPISAAKDYLGMSSDVLARIYAHSNLDDLRRAAEAMSRNH